MDALGGGEKMRVVLIALRKLSLAIEKKLGGVARSNTDVAVIEATGILCYSSQWWLHLVMPLNSPGMSEYPVQ